MIDLERELRSLGEAHEMTWGPVEIDDIVTADSPGVSTPSKQPRRRLLVAVAVAAATILAIGLPLYLLGDDTAPPANTSVPTTVDTQTPTTVPSTPPTTAPAGSAAQDPEPNPDGPFVLTSEGPLSLAVEWTRMSVEVDDLLSSTGPWNKMTEIDGELHVGGPWVCRDDCGGFASPDGLEWRAVPAPFQPVDGAHTEVVDGHYSIAEFLHTEDGEIPATLRFAFHDGTEWVTGAVDSGGWPSENFFLCVAGGPDGESILRGVYESDLTWLIRNDGSSHLIPNPPNFWVGCIDGEIYSFAPRTAEDGPAALARLQIGEVTAAWAVIPLTGETPGGLFGPVHYAGDRVFVETETGEVWTTTNFNDWQLARGLTLRPNTSTTEPPPGLEGAVGQDLIVSRTDFGWIASEATSGAFFMVSADGVNWESLDTPRPLQKWGYANGIFVVRSRTNVVWLGRLVDP